MKFIFDISVYNLRSPIICKRQKWLYNGNIYKNISNMFGFPITSNWQQCPTKTAKIFVPLKYMSRFSSRSWFDSESEMTATTSTSTQWTGGRSAIALGFATFAFGLLPCAGPWALLRFSKIERSSRGSCAMSPVVRGAGMCTSKTTHWSMNTDE